MKNEEAILRPVVTEKNSDLNQSGVYVFEVKKAARKPEIKTAIEKLFGVKVESVNTIICRGRAKRNRFTVGKVPHWKKALVKLKAGDKITLFEGA